MNPCRFVIDGTNVVFVHGRSRPELRYVLALCSYLSSREENFIAFFDANTRYLLEDHSPEQFDIFERLMEGPRCSGHLYVVPSGTQADEWILGRAKEDGADVISNDKYRDRARHHRWIWKRRHAFVATRDALIIKTLDAEIPVLPTASQYL